MKKQKKNTSNATRTYNLLFDLLIFSEIYKAAVSSNINSVALLARFGERVFSFSTIITYHHLVYLRCKIV